MTPKRSNKPPRRSLYPCVTSYLIQVLQVLSACTVSGVMFFFISHLHGKSYTMPWMFFMLQASALLTLIAILGLSIWGCLRGPIPLIGSIIHGVLFVSWGIGFGLLAHAMSTTITRPCTTVYWGNSQGVQICTLYKALFAGAAMGVLSTLGATAVEISASRKLAAMRRRQPEDTVVLLTKGPADTRYMPVWGDDVHGRTHQYSGRG